MCVKYVKTHLTGECDKLASISPKYTKCKLLKMRSRNTEDTKQAKLTTTEIIPKADAPSSIMQKECKFNNILKRD